MNKRLIIAKSVVIATSMIGLSYADNYSALPTNTWTGFYAGVDAGFISNDVALKSQQLGFTSPSGHCDTNADFSTFFPGIQLGYMHQFTNLLVSGIEFNATFNTNQKGTLKCRCPNNSDVSDRFSFRNQMQRAIKGRIGRTQNGKKSVLLPYLTAGASFADIGLKYKNEGGDYYPKNHTQAGLLVGAGLEWSFRKNWSLRAEYAYVDYGKTIRMKIPSVYGLIDPDGHARADLNTNSVLLAINYWI